MARTHPAPNFVPSTIAGDGPTGLLTASQVPLDVLATVFCQTDLGLRDRGAVRLVCRHWRNAIDRLTVHRLALRSPGPGQCALQLLRRFPLLQSLFLGSTVTSNRAALAWALSAMPSLVQLTRLSLEFCSPAAVRLPASLQALTQLQALALSVGVVQPGVVQTHGHAAATAAAVSVAGISADDDGDGDGGAGRIGVPYLGNSGGSSLRAAAAASAAAAAAAAAAANSAAGGGGGFAAAAVPAAAPAQHVPPSGLLPLLSKLSCLASLELSNLPISVPDVLAAVRKASSFSSASSSSAARRTTGSGADGRAGADNGLRRLVLVGSGVNLTGVGDPAAVAQLAMLETLYVDGCTGADALVPLLRHLRGVRHLTLAGMDYAWAAAAGYHHRRAGFDSNNDLNQFDIAPPQPQQQPPQPQPPNAPPPPQPAFDIFALDGVGAGGADGLMEGGGADGDAAAAAAAAALAAAASGRPLAFLLCLPQLSSLSLAGSFLRTLPNRDIGGLAVLTALDLSGNGIDDLPQGLASLPLLARLDVSHNQLVSLPPWLAQMQSLESLSAHHNCLERFPALLYDMTRLSYLAMGHNRISWWPVECVIPRHRRLAAAAAGGGLNHPAAAPPPGGPSSPSHSAASPTTPTGGAAASAAAASELSTAVPPLSLVSLDLSHNRLFGLPGGLPLLRALRCLRLRESLAGLDGAGTTRAMALLGGLTGLRELDLSSNHLDQHSIVPLSELRGLRQLWLADNGLEELPLGLARLSHLTLLSLRANRFTEVPVCLRWLTCLECLDLSCNRLSELPPWVGGGLPIPTNGHGEHDHNHHEDRRRSGGGSGGGAGAGAGGGGGGPQRPNSPPDSNNHNHSNQHQPCSPATADVHPNYHHHPDQHRHPQQQQQQLFGLVGLRHLDVSQQYSVAVVESGLPHIPPRLEVQPPHCLYGPLQGDLPSELLRLPALRCLVLQRHPLLGLAGSSVLRKLQARGVAVIHPRPLRVEALPGAAAAAFTSVAAAGGLLFPSRHPHHHSALLAGGSGAAAAARLSAAAARLTPPLPLGSSSSSAAAAAAAARATFFSPRESAVLLALMVFLPLATAAVCAGLGLPPPPHVVVLVVVVASTRLALYGIFLGRDAERRRQRRLLAAAAAAAAMRGGGGTVAAGAAAASGGAAAGGGGGGGGGGGPYI